MDRVRCLFLKLNELNCDHQKYSISRFWTGPFFGVKPVSTQSNWILKAPGAHNRLEAFFSGRAYSLHRHDTYAIGFTLGGVQSFKYRGAARNSEVGHCVILHPDELHDGKAGTEVGFHYSVAYVDPARIQAVLGGRALPFIEGGISSDPRLCRAVHNLLGDLGQELGELEYEDALYDLAVALEAVSGQAKRSRRRFDYASAELARRYITSHMQDTINLDDLEKATGKDRFKLSRDFRALFGTSPYRYLLMRRLEQARTMLAHGESPASAAAACSFTDQSHMNRHFKKTYGQTPGQWLKTLRIN